jgi:hypothetical protein
MPKMNWSAIEESTGGFADIEPGAYTLVVTKVEPHERQQYVRLCWDVAEGERKGAYAQSQYPPSDVLSWKDAALGMLKHKLHVLADHNPGFQSSVAFDNDDWQAFVGKRFGAVVRRRLYTAGPNSKSPGADRHQMEIAAYLSPDDLAANKFNRNLLEDRDQRDPQAKAAAEQRQMLDAGASAEIADEDIPF